MLKDPRKIATLACLVLLVVIIVFAWAIFRTNRLSSSAQEMALQVVENAFTEDYPSLLIENLHPDYETEFSEEALVRFVQDINSRTGLLESLESIRGSAEIPLMGFGQSEYSASYVLKLIFRDTPADVQIELQFTEARWQITRFDVIAEAIFL